MSENVPNAIEEISEEDWAQTPESVKRLVRSLLGRTLAIRTTIRRIESGKRGAARAGAAK